MKPIKKIAIIGHFGGQEHFTDGQTVKTLNLYKELSTQTEWKIVKVDTYYKDKTPFTLFIKMIATLFTTKKIIVLLSGNGMKVFFPILYLFTFIRGTDVYHDVIGGNLAQYVAKFPKYKRYLNSFKVNWVETNKLKKELVNQDVLNAEVVPNFRRVKIIGKNEFPSVYEAPYCFCTFSRVTKEKGIEDAIKAIEEINFECKQRICRLDIYGPIDVSYECRFNEIMKQASDAISYCGEVASAEAIPTLKKYYGVLFPTRWDGEGNAGTVTESFFSGVPVIATDWRCNKEMIVSGYNGFLYPGDLGVDLIAGVRWLIEHKDRISEIKNNCTESAKRYLPDEHIEKIVNTIQRK